MMSIFKKIISKIDPYIFVLIILTIITHLVWFDIDSTLFFGDWSYRNDLAVSQIAGMLGRSTWISFYDFGGTNIQIYSFPMTYIWGILKNYALGVKLTMFWPIAFLSVLAPYFLVKELFKNKTIAFFSALVYGFNSYIIVKTIGHLNIAFVYTLAPLMVLFWYRFLIKWQKKDLFIFIFLFFIGVVYEIRIMYIISFVLIIFTIPYLMKFISTQKKILLKGMICLLFLNLFWILPTLFMGSKEISAVANRGLWGNDLFTLINSIAFFDWHWTGDELMKKFINQPVPFYFFIVSIVSTIPLFFYKKDIIRKNRILIFIAYIILLLGITLSKQVDAPFTHLYKWLYDNFPGFNLFRLANKFYILIAFGYSILYGVGSYILLSNIKNKFLYNSLFLILVFVPLINVKPLISREIQTTYIDRNKPSEYEFVDDLVGNDDNFFRTLWVPVKSQWSYYDMFHPKITMATVLNKSSTGQKQLGIFSDLKPSLSNFSNPLFYSNSMKNYGQTMLRISSIKYVIIPMQLPESEDRVFPYAGDRESYLEELNKINYLNKIRDDKITIYKNEKYNPHIYTTNLMQVVQDAKYLKDKYTFITNSLQNEFDFIVDDEKKNVPSIKVSQVFEDVGSDNFVNNTISVKKQKEDNLVLFVDKNNRDVVVKVYKNKLFLISKLNDGLNIDGQSVEINSDDEVLFSGLYGRDYYIKKSDEFVGLMDGDDFDFNEDFDIYNVDEVREISDLMNGVKIPASNPGRPSLEQNSIHLDAGMTMDTGMIDGVGMIVDTGMISMGTNMTRDKYLLEFDYEVLDGENFGYTVTFDNGEKIVQRIKVDGQNVGKYEEEIIIPYDVNSFFVELYSDDLNNVEYADAYIKLLRYIQSAEAESESDFVKIDLSQLDGDGVDYGKIPASAGMTVDIGMTDGAGIVSDIDVVEDEYVFEYKNDNYDFENLIQNPSFEENLWQEKVGDCHNYDDNPILAMEQSDNASHGNKSLELQATRHIACTSQKNIDVENGGIFLLKFDYQSDNAKVAGYYVGFDDKNKTNVSEKLPIENSDWNAFEKQIEVPSDATKASLSVYSYPEEGSKENEDSKNIITRYDNFYLMKLPDIQNRYYIVNEPDQKFVNPRETNFEIINPTKKLVSIKGATTPFYLTMSESYHDKWQLQLNNEKVNGFWDKWVPFVKPDVIADEQHFKYMTFLNGWYVDPVELCDGGSEDGGGLDSRLRGNDKVGGNDNRDSDDNVGVNDRLGNDVKSGCTKNPDGSYDIEMVIEFIPQRWFYLGLLISGTTFVCLVGYLGYDFVRGWRRKKIEKREIG